MSPAAAVTAPAMVKKMNGHRGKIKKETIKMKNSTARELKQIPGPPEWPLGFA
jgi:hypothetical protein